DRQVSGAGGRGGADLDGDLERRLPAAEHRVSIRQESAERGDFESEVFGGGGGESGADAYQVQDAGADGTRQHVVLGREIRARERRGMTDEVPIDEPCCGKRWSTSKGTTLPAAVF